MCGETAAVGGTEDDAGRAMGIGEVTEQEAFAVEDSGNDGAGGTDNGPCEGVGFFVGDAAG